MSETKDQPGKMVVGFMFDPKLQKVVLIEKARPDWQSGRCNGVGGKVKEGESVLVAMAREFKEETGVITDPLEWTHFATMAGNNNDGEPFEIDFFFIKSQHYDHVALQPGEDEPPVLAWVSDIRIGDNIYLDNIAWLVGLAYDCAKDGRPHKAHITYL